MVSEGGADHEGLVGGARGDLGGGPDLLASHALLYSSPATAPFVGGERASYLLLACQLWRERVAKVAHI